MILTTMGRWHLELLAGLAVGFWYQRKPRNITIVLGPFALWYDE